MTLPTLIRITTVPMSLNVLLKGQLRFMKDYFNVLAVSSGPEKELNEAGNREEVPTIQIEMTRAITPFKDIRAVWQLYCLFKKEKPLIVHTHTPKAGTLGMLAAKLARVQYRLHTVAGLPLLEATGFKRKLLNIVERITYSCATKIYPNSKGLYNIIAKEGYCSFRKMSVIGNGSSNGIDTTHFSPLTVNQEQRQSLRESLGILPNDFVFIFVGRLVGDKGVNELVRAFNSILFYDQGISSRSRVKLLLVGPTEAELDPLQSETLKKIKNNPNIISVGFQKDVRPYFAISDCLVFPSYREGFPNVVMQAGAMGLPSIVSNINGCNEIIEEGVNGTIIPVKDTMALQTAMIRLISDSDFHKKLQSNTRTMIQSRYEQSVVWNALLEEYKSLIYK